MSTDPVDLETGAPEREPEREERPVVKPILPAAVRGLKGPARASAAAQVVVAILAVLAACYVAKIVFVVLLVAILVAFMLAPLVDWLERLRVPRPVGAGIAVLLLCAALYGLTYYSYSKAQDFVNDWPRYREKVQSTLAKVRSKAQSFQKTAQDVLPQQEAPPTPVQTPAPQPTRRGQPPPPQPTTTTVKLEQPSRYTEWLTSWAGSLTEAVLMISFIPFLVYFMLSWQEHVRANTVMLFRMENRNTAYVTLGAISRMIRSFIVGNVVVGLFMSGVAIIVFGALQLPYFYFIAFISGFLSLVPYLGVVLALAPPLLAGLGQIHTSEAVIIVVTVLSLHIFALNVLYPKIVGSRVQLNPLVVTLALLMWGWLWGAMGLVLAVPLTAAMKIIFDHVDSLRAYGAWMGE